MPLAPPVAMSQNATANAIMLTMDGFDLMRVPGSTIPSYGVPLESIEIVEAGPGAVSSLRFSVDDPNVNAPLPQVGSQIRMHDLVNDVPLFRGTVNNYQVLPMGVGRIITVDCDGPETVLDNIVASAGIAAGQLLQDAIVAMASLNLFGVSYMPSGTANGTGPGGLGLGGLGGFITRPTADFAVTVTNVTFREAVRQFVASGPALGLHNELGRLANLTVDMYGGVRLFNAGEQPQDWTTLTVTDTGAGANAAVNLNYEVHPADIVHELYIIGGGGLTGWFGDGTGIRGKQASISDSTLDTAAKMQTAANAYFALQAANVRGTFNLDPFAPATTVHAGGLVTITDANAGIATTYTISTITKRFAGGKVTLQSWQVEFGGRRPSMANSVRILTRSTLG